MSTCTYVFSKGQKSGNLCGKTVTAHVAEGLCGAHWAAMQKAKRGQSPTSSSVSSSASANASGASPRSVPATSSERMLDVGSSVSASASIGRARVPSSVAELPEPSSQLRARAPSSDANEREDVRRGRREQLAKARSVIRREKEDVLLARAGLDVEDEDGAEREEGGESGGRDISPEQQAAFTSLVKSGAHAVFWQVERSYPEDMKGFCDATAEDPIIDDALDKLAIAYREYEEFVSPEYLLAFGVGMVGLNVFQQNRMERRMRARQQAGGRSEA
mmetsp:Transcript_13192/g.14818  ORF Transcript_13192/g.14818 Transcript_13192/m.14818 type:complete len:275 (+) Transcript_13192:110-934(+)|eukprot:CAMPEP_0205823778 /NCGR_PEP_ID=MMETSP0206-20130828/17866_1 /ASSEMBLY_ACC=CAM_ASM_000279 /TAXON_ID=36767 /ORGANISM="Euplotes focardii, Strain TN1" /LENGTH=274 /DNA_ID=CAMNT_0053121251 /DNA_START=50 /DNA_END=874 /DNA_ORIENTATION=-